MVAIIPPIDRSQTSPNRTVKRSRTIRRIVIHHWDEPQRKPTFDGTVSWLMRDSTDVSAHYVVESGRITALVPEKDVAYHARGGNSDSIGIEINPRQHDGDYETAAALIADIRRRLGPLPLVRHRAVDGSSTTCPGTFDLARLDRLASGGATPKPASAPAFPLPRRTGKLCYYGPADGPITSVSGKGLNSLAPADVVKTGGRWHSIGLAKWQARMSERGYTIAVDGRYGPETERIVRYFQRLVGLPVDGKIGPDTWKAAWEVPVK